MKKYSVVVWYRFTVSGEQEKEMQDYTIEALSPEDAIVQALSKFKSLAAIPFSVECNQIF